MTKSILVTNLNEIKSLKVCCKNCKASWSIPFTSGPLEEEKCISCGEDVPYKNIYTLGQKINELKKHCKSCDFEIFIETELV